MEIRKRNLYGKIIRISEIADLNFTESVHSENTSLPFHSHDFAYFCFILQGNFTEKYKDNKKTLGSSSMIFHPLGEKHSDFFHTESRCLNIQLNSRFVRYLDNEDFVFRPMVAQRLELLRIVSRLYKEFCEMDEFSTLTVEGLMLELIAEFLRGGEKRNLTSAPKWLIEARDYIKEEFTNNLTISDIAHTVGIHPTHLAKEFRSFFNSTIGDFIRQQRIAFACQKIINSNAPLSEISAESGFYDQSHFTKVFRKTTQTTPAEFRAIYKEN